MRPRIGVTLAVAMLTLVGMIAIAGPAAATGPHVLTASPSTGLVDGQTVAVSGTGFVESPTPFGVGWVVTECAGAVLSGPATLESVSQDCVTSGPAGMAQSDAAGNLTGSDVVHKTFTSGGGGSVTCGQAPNDCAIGVFQFTDQGFIGVATPISFGPVHETLAQCVRDFVHDRDHSLRYRLVHLLICALDARTGG